MSSTAPAEKLSNDQNPKTPIFFWREFEEPYGFLSQWFLAPFEVDGVTYMTTEMWMMVEKARLFADEQIVKQMLQTKDPRKHKALGRKVKGFENAKWNREKDRIVQQGNYHKFTKNKSVPDMMRRLLATGDRELVEASPLDWIWGIGYAAADALQNRPHWGENRLGKALMVVREQLRQEGQ